MENKRKYKQRVPKSKMKTARLEFVLVPLDKKKFIKTAKENGDCPSILLQQFVKKYNTKGDK